VTSGKPNAEFRGETVACVSPTKGGLLKKLDRGTKRQGWGKGGCGENTLRGSLPAQKPLGQRTVRRKEPRGVVRASAAGERTTTRTRS